MHRLNLCSIRKSRSLTEHQVSLTLPLSNFSNQVGLKANCAGLQARNKERRAPFVKFEQLAPGIGREKDKTHSRRYQTPVTECLAHALLEMRMLSGVPDFNKRRLGAFTRNYPRCSLPRVHLILKGTSQAS